MTAFKTVTINCDWQRLDGREHGDDGCVGWFEVDSPSVTETRKAAKKAGWRSLPEPHHAGRADICPMHAEVMGL